MEVICGATYTGYMLYNPGRVTMYIQHNVLKGISEKQLLLSLLKQRSQTPGDNTMYLRSTSTSEFISLTNHDFIAHTKTINNHTCSFIQITEISKDNIMQGRSNFCSAIQIICIIIHCGILP